MEVESWGTCIEKRGFARWDRKVGEVRIGIEKSRGVSDLWLESSIESVAVNGSRGSR